MSNLPNDEGDEKGRDKQTTGGKKKPDPAARGSTPPLGAPIGQTGPLFRENTFRGGEIPERFLTAKEVLAQDGTDVDFFCDRAFGRFRIRYPDGTDSGIIKKLRGLGPDVGIPFLDEILWSAGARLGVDDLNGTLVNIREDSRARATLVRRVRRLFHDTVDLEWFILVGRNPWTVALNVGRTWKIIERR